MAGAPGSSGGPLWSRLRHVWHQFKGVSKQLRALFDKAALERELDEEIEFHVARETEKNVAEGMDPAEARRRALLEFRGREGTKERVRDARWTRLVEDALTDLHYGARSLRKGPGFALAAVLTLALGIGGTTAVFSVVKPVLFEALPYPDSGRVVTVSDVAPDGSELAVAFGSLREVEERSSSFDDLAAMKPWRPTLTGAGEPVRLEGQRVGADYFRVLGVAPLLGRDFEPADDRLRGPDLAIVAHGLWRTRLGGDPDAVGHTITLDGDAYTVIGVMPAGFENVASESARIWAPLQYDATAASFEGREWGHHLRVVGRLRSGVTMGEARRELAGIAANPVTEFPRPEWASLERGLRVTSLRESVTGGARSLSLAVLGAVTLLLSIGCANVTNLLLARGAGRRHEFAMRAALGAGRARMARQLVTESLLLAGLGGALGLALAVAGVRTLSTLGAPRLPRMGAVQLDATVFAVAVGISTLVGAVVGLIPAIRASRGQPREAIQQRSSRIQGTTGLARGALVTAQVAISLVLLVGAGLLLRSLDRLFSVDPGFDPSGVLTLQVQVSGDRFVGDEVVRQYFTRVVEEVRGVSGVAAAALTSQLPLSGQADRYGVEAVAAPGESEAYARQERAPAGEGQDDFGGAFRYTVSPGYFRVMGIPLRRGRVFDDRDVAGVAPTAVVSESLARRRFPNQDPLGRQIHVGRTDLPPYTIVGVVGDTSQLSLAAGRADGVYVPRAHWYFVDVAMWLVVAAEPGTSTEPRAAELAPAVKAAVWSVDDDQPIVRVATMQDLAEASAAERRFALRLFQAFALVALVLAAFGIHGVMAGTVAERRREIGVRSALGASRRDVVSMVVRQGMTLTALGIFIGLAGAMAASQALVALLFEVSRLDPITYLGGVVLLVAVAGMACAVPAWRAARVDPCLPLRTEG